MQFRPFDKHDDMGFEGAEDWDACTPPLIGEGKLATGQDVVVVLDRTGAGLMVDGEEQTICGGWKLHLPFPTQQAALAFGTGLGEPDSLEAFLALGFEPL